MNNEMIAGIEKLKAAMIADYKRFKFSDEMRENYANGIATKAGKKYIKVITRVNSPEGSDGSAYAFIVNIDDDPKFPRGTILKPASWNAPTRNMSRGNVLRDNEFNVSAFGI